MWPFKKSKIDPSEILLRVANGATHAEREEYRKEVEAEKYPVYRPGGAMEQRKTAQAEQTTLDEVRRLRSIVAGLSDQSGTALTYLVPLGGYLREIRDRLPNADEKHLQLLNNIKSGMENFPKPVYKQMEEDSTGYAHGYAEGVEELSKFITQIIDGR